MNLDNLTTDQLKELIKIYARNIYALDGLWFQSIEQENGMEIAIHHDRNTWQHFTEIEAQRIKKLLQLPDNGYPAFTYWQSANSLILPKLILS